MRTFVKSIKRLFGANKVTEEYVNGLLENEKISEEEKEFILN